jgi:hypothetical protein
MEQPDPKWHLRISILKSMLRIGAGAYLMMGAFVAAGSLLIAAELLGILEELV